ncbi:MAG: NAD-dependent epimerase/dehydratase family protein [Ruminococcus sp.]
MKKVLVTGGTVFVSRYIAEYFEAKGEEVYVLNRNTRQQSEGVKLIEADRHDLGECLQKYHFDAVIDTGYTAKDVNLLLDALDECEAYVFISSSAVYPEYAKQPFQEYSELNENKFWGKYGTDKIEAEKALLKRNPNAYILRPPYLYGQMNNVYREAFVFDCALENRKFYIPQNGEMKLQFFHVHDLCRFIDIILERKPSEHIFNVGNKETISVREWAEICYNAVGKQAGFVSVDADIEQRKYFPFYNYEYCLDVSKQYELMPNVKTMQDGLSEAFAWYINNHNQVNKKALIDFIDSNFV